MMLGDMDPLGRSLNSLRPFLDVRSNRGAMKMAKESGPKSRRELRTIVAWMLGLAAGLCFVAAAGFCCCFTGGGPTGNPYYFDKLNLQNGLLLTCYVLSIFSLLLLKTSWNQSDPDRWPLFYLNLSYWILGGPSLIQFFSRLSM